MTKNQTVQEIPRDAITAAATTVEHVLVGIRRTGERGHWSGVRSGIRMGTLDLLGIEAWLAPRAGGGAYRIETSDPMDPTKQPIPPFMVRIEGRPKPFSDPNDPTPPDAPAYPAPLAPPNAPGAYAYNPYAPQYAPPTAVPGHMPQGYPPRPSTERGRKGLELDPRTIWNQTPDQIAVAQLRHAQEQQQRTEDRLLADRAVADRRERELRTEIAKLQASMAEQRASAERSLHEERIATLTAAVNNRQAPAMDMVGMASALSPVFVQMMTSNGQRAEAAAAQQSKTLEHTTGMMSAMATRPADDGWTKVLPVLVPLAQSWMDQRSPGKQAELIGAVGDQMLTQTSMMSQVIEMFAQMQPDDGPMASMLRELASGMNRYAQSMIDDQRPAAATPVQTYVQQPAQSQAPQAQEAPPPIPGVPPAEQIPESAGIAEMWARIPPYFHTQEWSHILHFVAAQQEAALPALAETIAGHLENLDRVGTMPAELAGVLDDPTVLRVQFLEPVAGDNPVYIGRLTEAVARALNVPVVTPPPAEPASDGNGAAVVDQAPPGAVPAETAPAPPQG